MLVCWHKWLVNQVSDVPSIIFFSKFPAKFFPWIVSIIFLTFFYRFTKMKIMSFECPFSIRNHKRNHAWNIICPSEPANQLIMYCRLSDFNFYLTWWIFNRSLSFCLNWNSTVQRWLAARMPNGFKFSCHIFNAVFI